MFECNNLTSGYILVQKLDNLVFYCINLAKHMLGEFFIMMSIYHYIKLKRLVTEG